MNIDDYASLFGNYKKVGHSPGLFCLTADRQIKQGTVEVNDVGNAKAFLKDQRTGKWCIVSGGFGNDSIKTMMLGAICGDVAGSIYEWHNIKYCPDKHKIVQRNAHYTDDSVMTCAVATGIKNALSNADNENLDVGKYDEVIEQEIIKSMVEFGRKFPHAGYGGSFRKWLNAGDRKPYYSWGNGAAMRCSYAGWVARTLEEAEHFAELSARVTHNHPEAIKAAKAIAGSIFVARTYMGPLGVEPTSDELKTLISEYIKQYYEIGFTLDEIRNEYKFDVSCQGSVPQAFEALFEGDDFSDVISKAISIGGDSDTIAAIAGSVAEVIYPIPQGFRGRVIDRLDRFLRDMLIDAIDFAVLRTRQ